MKKHILSLTLLLTASSAAAQNANIFTEEKLSDSTYQCAAVETDHDMKLSFNKNVNRAVLTTSKGEEIKLKCMVSIEPLELAKTRQPAEVICGYLNSNLAINNYELKLNVDYHAYNGESIDVTLLYKLTERVGSSQSHLYYSSCSKK